MSINKYIDHTLLKPTTTLKEIGKLCEEAVEFNFAAVCVPPLFAKIAKELTRESDVKMATVIGFPFGYSAIEAKTAEIVLAIIDEADELDMVANLSAIKTGDWDYLEQEISTIMPLIINKQRTIKVIIESGILSDEEIVKCCELYSKYHIHYLKTSTGFASKGASVHAVELMRSHLPETVKIKASGGIRTYQFAEELIAAGADRIGCSSSLAILEGQLKNNMQ